MSQSADALLCRLSELPDPGSKGFAVGGPDVNLFVVLRDGVLRAYRNRCPHTGAPLEWKPDQFLDIENYFIQCSIHGALFQVGDGLCIRGPCVGATLQAIPVSVRDDEIFVSEADIPSD
ncbi:MAG: Rieske (2Fe-2S) protein [Chromatiales bacterium]|jgi:nitrite reductase/ring-hydroxylating ferredoxin subunit